jgi:hypothetical protein
LSAGAYLVVRITVLAFFTCMSVFAFKAHRDLKSGNSKWFPGAREAYPNLCLFLQPAALIISIIMAFNACIVVLSITLAE